MNLQKALCEWAGCCGLETNAPEELFTHFFIPRITEKYVDDSDERRTVFITHARAAEVPDVPINQERIDDPFVAEITSHLFKTHTNFNDEVNACFYIRLTL